jgi:hypothetical protein
MAVTRWAQQRAKRRVNSPIRDISMQSVEGDEFRKYQGVWRIATRAYTTMTRCHEIYICIVCSGRYVQKGHVYYALLTKLFMRHLLITRISHNHAVLLILYIHLVFFLSILYTVSPHLRLPVLLIEARIVRDLCTNLLAIRDSV